MVYTEVLAELYLVRDEKFKSFSQRVVNSDKPLLGVKIPVLRKIADKLLKDGYGDYLNECEFRYFEDTLIYGLIIARLSYDDFFKYLPTYVGQADSWAHIDSFVPSIKFINKRKDDFLRFIKHEIKNAEGFYLRFFIVCLMNHYLDEANIEYSFSVCKSYDGKGYYNDMAIAWLISVAFVKMRDKTLDFIKEGKLSSFTLNKAISKIRDSFRVSREDKLLLQKFIRKN